MNTKKKNGHSFRVGDRVLAPFGLERQVATIVEDRGNIGHKGCRLWGVTFQFPYTDPIYTEFPEDDLSPAD